MAVGSSRLAAVGAATKVPIPIIGPLIVTRSFPTCAVTPVTAVEPPIAAATACATCCRVSVTSKST